LADLAPISAIEQVLNDEVNPMQARDVHAQAETLLGEPVRWASVKATLAGNLEGPAPSFVRAGRGLYGVPLLRTRTQSTCGRRRVRDRRQRPPEAALPRKD
jgi:hypothetical protein